MNSFKPLKVVIFGAKYGVYCLIPAFLKTDLVEIVGICSPTNKNKSDAIKKYNIPYSFNSIDEVFKKIDFDIAAIAVPPKQQEKIILKCISKKINIFAEKPLGSNLDSVKNIINSLQNSKIKTTIDFSFPENEIWENTKELIQQKIIGELRHVIVNWAIESYDNKNKILSWKNDKKQGGGAYSHFGSHILHYLEWFCGPIKILNSNLYNYKNYFNTGDTLTNFSGKFKSEVSYSATICTAATFGMGHRIDFYGENGCITLINDNASYLDFSLIVQKYINGQHERKVYRSKLSNLKDNSDERITPVSKLAKRFILSIINDDQMKPSFEDALKVQIYLEDKFYKVN